MVSFKLGKEMEKDVYRLVTNEGGIEPQIFGFRAPMLYH